VGLDLAIGIIIVGMKFVFGNIQGICAMKISEFGSSMKRNRSKNPVPHRFPEGCFQFQPRIHLMQIHLRNRPVLTNCYFISSRESNISKFHSSRSIYSQFCSHRKVR
jgi:hypothetical protein